MHKAFFGTLPDGRAVEELTLSNGALTVRLLTLGAILQDVRLGGIAHSLTLGSKDLAAYSGAMHYFGAIVGPVANRIAGAAATLDGRRLELDRNEDGRTALHSGYSGTHAQVWRVLDAGGRHADLALSLPDGLGGFPGNREIMARFTLADPAVLELRLEATTDAPTFMNLAHHGYWNLDGTPTVEGHRLRVPAESWLSVDDARIPTGEVRPVAGTAWDFRDGPELGLGRGYDHNLCLAPQRRALAPAAELVGRSGTILRIDTTEPGLQLYDGARIDTAPHLGHGGAPYGAHAGIALEPQVWPDAPNRPSFPSAVLRPGETYRQETRFTFSAAAGF